MALSFVWRLFCSSWNRRGAVQLSTWQLVGLSPEKAGGGSLGWDFNILRPSATVKSGARGAGKKIML